MLSLANATFPEPTGLFCEHLSGFSLEEVSCARYFVGQGCRYALVCDGCVDQFYDEAVRPALVTVGEEEFRRWESEALGDEVLGKPEVLTRKTGLKFQQETALVLPGILAVAPSSAGWLAMTKDHRVWDLSSGRARFQLDVSDLHLGRSASLSALDDYLLLSSTRGRFGAVYSLPTGRRLLLLDRGNYHINVTNFSAVLCRFQGRPVVVHATDWNRLDVTDLTTLRCLTERAHRKHPEKERLDYFHAGLSVSPSGEWIADAGWSWHPTGEVRCWSLARWLDGHPYESETGASVQRFCRRDYHWDAPMCWLDGQTLAVWGEGADDLRMLDAVQFYDIPSGTKVGWFPGPRPYGEGNDVESGPVVHRERMAFDRYLFAMSPTMGTSVWDVSTGACLHHDLGLRPVTYHDGRFLCLTERGAILTRLITS